MISSADAFGRSSGPVQCEQITMSPLFARTQQCAHCPESLRVTFDILEQRRRCANVITASRDCFHFKIPIDLYFDPLNFIELFQDVEKISEVIHFHCSLLCRRGAAYFGPSKVGANLRRSIQLQQALQLTYSQLDSSRER